MYGAAHKIQIVGNWGGIVIERAGDQYPIRLSLDIADLNDSDFQVKGIAEVTHPDHDKFPMVMMGRFLNGTAYIQLDYSNQDPGIIHFGTILLELSREATELEGEFMALSPVDECLISGTVSLVKEHA